MSRAILAVWSDSHAGHKLGLCNPDTPFEDEGEDGSLISVTPQLCQVQEYLWHDIYIPGIRAAYKLAAGDPIIVVHLGDQAQARKHDAEYMTTSLHSHINIAYNNWLPWMQVPGVKAIRAVIGTAAHNAGQGSLEYTSTKMLRLSYPQADIKVAYHYLINLQTNGSALIDIAHHGPGPGSRSWLRGNVARFYLRDLIHAAALAGEPWPSLVLRGHFHTLIKEYLDGSWLCIVPSMCGLGEFARQVTRSAFQLVNGILLVEVADGKIRDINLAGKSIDIRSNEVITI